MAKVCHVQHIIHLSLFLTTNILIAYVLQEACNFIL